MKTEPFCLISIYAILTSITWCMDFRALNTKIRKKNSRCPRGGRKSLLFKVSLTGVRFFFEVSRFSHFLPDYGAITNEFENFETCELSKKIWTLVNPAQIQQRSSTTRSTSVSFFGISRKSREFLTSVRQLFKKHQKLWKLDRFASFRCMKYWPRSRDLWAYTAIWNLIVC